MQGMIRSITHNINIYLICYFSTLLEPLATFASEQNFARLIPAGFIFTTLKPLLSQINQIPNVW